MYPCLTKSITALLLIAFTQTAVAQQPEKLRPEFAYSDTTLFEIGLPDSLPGRLLIVGDNKNCIIYMEEDSLLQMIRKRKWQGYEKGDSTVLVHKIHLSGGKAARDLSSTAPYSLRYLIGDAMEHGEVIIYDKSNGAFVKKIYHRMERVISDAYQWFYFSPTDRRYLFRVHRYSGIIPNEYMPDIE